MRLRAVSLATLLCMLITGSILTPSRSQSHPKQTTAETTTRVSVASDGTQGNGSSYAGAISADGRYVAFVSDAYNLVPNDTNGSDDVFVHDRVTGQTTRVSVASDGTQGNSSSSDPSISANGRYIAFLSLADNLVPNDTNGSDDVFVHDRVTGQTTRVSVASDGTQGNNESYNCTISADGRYVAFGSYADNLVPDDTNSSYDVFVHDRVTGQTTRVSVASDGTQGDGGDFFSELSVSADGRYVAFGTFANNLVPNDTDHTDDVFVHDRMTGQTTLVSVASDGTHGNHISADSSISADGRYVAFRSYADNLVPNDTNNYEDVFVHDRVTGQTTRVSVASNGTQGNSNSAYYSAPSISADGRYVAFGSGADNLVPNDTNNGTDIFVRDRGEGSTPPTPTPTPGPSPTPEPPPGNDTHPVPGRPAQQRTVGNVTVYADSFADTTGGWTTSGTVWLGDYTIVESAQLSASGSSLSGHGTVSMITTADASQRTVFFTDQFSVNTTNGTLTPQFVSGYDFKLRELVGFHIEQSLLQVTVDVLKGRVQGTVNLKVVIPQNDLLGAVSFTIDHTGAISGSLRDIDLSLGLVTLKVKEASLGPDGLRISRADLKLPNSIGGASANFSATDARITSDGKFDLGGASVQIKFPNMRIGSSSKFGIDGASVTISYDNGQWLFTGAGTFILPGTNIAGGGCKIGTSFTFASTPPPLREAELSISGCFKIPIGTTGFFLSSISGKVALDADSTSVDIEIGIEGGPEVPGLGAAISGHPRAHWDSSWAIALSGTLKVFKFDVAEASLELSPSNGFKGTLSITQAGVVHGSGSIHVWKDSKFHFTGRQNVAVRVDKGQIYQKCARVLGFDGCVSVPLTTIEGPQVGADFGEFRTPNGSVYGLKGYMDILGYHPAFFVDAQGNRKFDLGGLREYQLAGLQRAAATSDDIRNFVVDGDTPALLVELAALSGAPTLTLRAPDGTTYMPGDPGIVTTIAATQTLLTVPNPAAGSWQAIVGNPQGDEVYLIAALGSRPSATISVPSVTPNGDGSFTIAVAGTSSSPTSTLSLFYDTSDSAFAGIPIVQDLPLTTPTYLWKPVAVPSGTYTVYAMVDDPLGAPVYAMAPTTVTIDDNTPPDTPTNLQISSQGDQGTITWNASAAPDTAGYRIYIHEPDSDVLLVTEVPDAAQTTYIQQGLYVDGTWTIQISAYDLSGNESPLSTLASTVVQQATQNDIYLPFIVR